MLVLIPITLALYTFYDNRNYGLISLTLMLLALVPFLMRYEMKKPPARDANLPKTLL